METGLRGVNALYLLTTYARTPLEWFIDRYRVTRDRKSGILNDANEWFQHPEDLITAIRRIVHLSVETVGIVEKLPPSIAGLEK